MVGPWAQRTLPGILVPLHSALWVAFVLRHAGLGWGQAHPQELQARVLSPAPATLWGESSSFLIFHAKVLGADLI